MSNKTPLADKSQSIEARRINSELEPFLNSIRTKKANFELLRNAYLSFRKHGGRAVRVFLDIGTAKVESDLFYVFSYLGIVESLGNAIVDLLVLLLVANGRDFYIECLHTSPRIKHVLKIEDLEEERVPLTTKLNFLRDNGLRFAASLIDTDLRNTIAHLKFETRDDKVYIRSKTRKSMRPLTRKELDTLLGKMLRGLLHAAVLIDALMKEKGVKTS
jgi:hypothetical protein